VQGFLASQISFALVRSVFGLVQYGRLRPLAVSGQNWVAPLPTAPAIAEPVRLRHSEWTVY
jgi:hypothetical protein